MSLRWLESSYKDTRPCEESWAGDGGLRAGAGRWWMTTTSPRGGASRAGWDPGLARMGGGGGEVQGGDYREGEGPSRQPPLGLAPLRRRKVKGPRGLRTRRPRKSRAGNAHGGPAGLR